MSIAHRVVNGQLRRHQSKIGNEERGLQNQCKRSLLETIEQEVPQAKDLQLYWPPLWQRKADLCFSTLETYPVGAHASATAAITRPDSHRAAQPIPRQQADSTDLCSRTAFAVRAACRARSGGGDKHLVQGTNLRFAASLLLYIFFLSRQTIFCTCRGHVP